MFYKVKSTKFKAYILLCAFLLQAIFPVGFMPAAFAGGVPVQLCHSVFPMSFLQSLEEFKSDSSYQSSHHSHHADHMSSEADGDNTSNDLATPEAKNQEFCAFGALNLDDVVSFSTCIVDAESSKAIHLVRLEAQLKRQRLRLFQSRAPPHLSFI